MWIRFSLVRPSDVVAINGKMIYYSVLLALALSPRENESITGSSVGHGAAEGRNTSDEAAKSET